MTYPTELVHLLDEEAGFLVQSAFEAMSRVHLVHYEEAGAAATRERLKLLFELTVRSFRERDLSRVVEHAERIANERFAEGFDLHEIQTAINVLEESIWQRIVQRIPPPALAESLGLASTVLGVAKDTLASRYVSLASKTHTESLNLQSLFRGSAGS